MRLKELRSAHVMQEYDGLHKKVVTLNEQLADVVDELAAARRDMESGRNAAVGIAVGAGRVPECRPANPSGSCWPRRTNRGICGSAAILPGEQVRQLTEQPGTACRPPHEISERLSARQSDVTKHQEALRCRG